MICQNRPVNEWQIAGVGYLTRPARRLVLPDDLTPAERAWLRVHRASGGAVGFADTLEHSILDHVFGKATYTAPANWYLGLSSTTPAGDGTNFTEPSSGSYGRVSTAPADWGSASGSAPSTTANVSAFTFATATGTWNSGDPMTHWGLFTASSGGTPKILGELTVARPVYNGDTPTAGAGFLICQIGEPTDDFNP